MLLLSTRIRKLADTVDLWPTAAMIVLNPEGKALILRRGQGAPWRPGQWNLPGGGIDEGETNEQAAIRELKEETGLQAVGVRKLRTIKYRGGGDAFILHLFFSKDFRGTLHLDKNENDKYEWVGLEDLSNYRFVPTVEDALREVLA